MLGELAWYKPVIHFVIGLGSAVAAWAVFARRDILA
jgi:hypothetical protein